MALARPGCEAIAAQRERYLRSGIELALEERRRALHRRLERGPGRAAMIEHHADLPAPLLLAIDPDQLSRARGRAPVDAAGVLARPIIPQRVHLQSVPRATRRTFSLARELARFEGRGRDPPGKDDQLGWRREGARLFEQAERRAGRHLQQHEAVHSAARRREPI